MYYGVLIRTRNRKLLWLLAVNCFPLGWVNFEIFYAYISNFSAQITYTFAQTYVNLYKSTYVCLPVYPDLHVSMYSLCTLIYVKGALYWAHYILTIEKDGQVCPTLMSLGRNKTPHRPLQALKEIEGKRGGFFGKLSYYYLTYYQQRELKQLPIVEK